MKFAHELTHNDLISLHRQSLGGKMATTEAPPAPPHSVQGLPEEGMGLAGLPGEGGIAPLPASGSGQDPIKKIMEKLKQQIIEL